MTLHKTQPLAPKDDATVPVPVPATQPPTFRREQVTTSMIDGTLVDICIAGSVLLGVDGEGRMLFRLGARARQYRGRWIVYSDVAEWRLAYEVSTAAFCPPMRPATRARA